MSDLVIFVRTIGERYFEQCLQRIKEHTPEPHRLVVWVNGGGSATAEIAGRYTDDLIVATKNRGCVGTCGYMLLYEDYRELVSLGCAIMVAPGWIPALRKPFADFGGVGLTGMRSEAGKYRTPSGTTEECNPDNLPDYLVMSTREVVDRVGSISPSFEMYGHENTEWALRAWHAGARVFAVETGARRFEERHDGRDALPDRDVVVQSNAGVWQQCAKRHYRDYDWWRSDL